MSSQPKKPQLRAIKFLGENQNTSSKNKKKDEKTDKTDDNKKTDKTEDKKTEDTKTEDAKTEDAKTEDDEKKDDENGIKNKYIFKNFITLMISALCLSISLGVNEVFLLYLRKKETGDIVLTIKYVLTLIFITLCVSYYFNLGIE